MTSHIGEPAGRVAVVTGSASGLGAALAHALAREQMAVAAIDIDRAGAEATAEALRRAGVDALAIGADVGDDASLAEAARTVDDHFGACHLLCANVSVVQLKPDDETSLDEWRWLLGLNVIGTVATVHAFLPVIRRSHGDRRIALTSSVAALQPSRFQGAYAASKAAITSYGETLRREFAGEGIGVSVIFPHGMRTTHLESSARVRPAGLGPVTDQRTIDAVTQEMASADTELISADEAVEHLVPQLLDDAPYIVTHGLTARPLWRQRVAEIEAAFDRMEAVRGYASRARS